MNVAEILNKAADLIEPEGAWCKFTMARDSKGDTVDAESPDAVCWCMAGALVRTESGYGGGRKALEAFLGEKHPVDFNNDGTQAEVVAALRAAAEKANQ